MNTSALTKLEQYDVIVVGGGSAGSVVAGRVSEDPNVKVLLIEAGKDNAGDPAVRHPIQYLSLLTSEKVKFYLSEPAHGAKGRTIAIPQANVLGGGSSVNFQMFSHGSASDYDAWGALGNEGWSFKDLHKYLLKCENYQEEDTVPGAHGKGGPINVSFGRHFLPKARLQPDAFLEAAEKVGIPKVADLHDFHTGHGASNWPKSVDGIKGTRSDAASAYLGKRDNLEVVTGVKVTKVNIDPVTKTATGVNIALSTDLSQSRSVSARQVVLSAGAFGSAQLLQVSGVGDKSVLSAAGVETLVDLPGVGKNYQDHTLLCLVFRVEPSVYYSHDGVAFGFDADAIKAAQEEFELKASGPLATNSIDVGIKLRPTEEEARQIPNFYENWKRDFSEKKDKPLLFLGHMSGFLGDPSIFAPGHYMTFGLGIQYPYSRGRVLIKSGDVSEPPVLKDGYATDDADIRPYIWGYKKARELARRMRGYRGEYEKSHPALSERSAARLTHLDQNIEVSEDLKYSQEDDKTIEEWTRASIGTAWHPMGTASMKPREDGGVVDSSLSVYGVKNLKVVDLSIAPLMVGANTNSTALAIGEKGADLVRAALAS